MDSPYIRFNSYDFDSDSRFQEGLRKVPTRELLELKIFYYNRFIEPIDLTGFQEWCDGLQTVTDGNVAVTKEIKCFKGNLCQKGEISGSEEQTKSNKETTLAQGDTLSFAEVFRMIQAGEEIPGLQNLDIKPCNQQPTVSQMSRVLKPWEK